MKSMIVLLLSFIGLALAIPATDLDELVNALEQRVEALKVAEEKFPSGVNEAGVQADADDEEVATFTKGQFNSCAEVQEAGLCGENAAKAGCAVTCADEGVQADSVTQEKAHNHKKSRVRHLPG